MKKRVALVLGSGGARGYAHIGVIEEIERRGYDIACIAGCSMGAVVGGIYAAGKLDEYRNWIESLDYLDVLRLVDVSFRLGAIRGEKVFGQIRKIVGEINIEELRIPYTAVATDLTNQQEIWFQEGCLHQAMRASAAIPSLFTPVMQGNRMLVDGGLLNPLPIVPVEALPFTRDPTPAGIQEPVQQPGEVTGFAPAVSPQAGRATDEAGTGSLAGPGGRDQPMAGIG